MTHPTPSTRTPAMGIHFTSMTVSQITDRAHKLMDEGTALAQLAAALVQFEESTGRKLFVSEADQGVSYVGSAGSPDRGPEIVFAARKAERIEVSAEPTPEPVPAKVDTPVEPIEVPCDLVCMPQKAQALGNAPAPEPIKKESPAVTAPVAAKRADDQKAIKKAASAPATNVQKMHSAPAAADNAKSAPKMPDNVQGYQTAKPQPANRPWGALNLAERRIVQHLEKLPDTFTAAEDLRLVELLTSGHKTPIAAAIMDVPVDQMVARWQAFMCPDVLGANGKPSIDGQKHLLAALRYRKDAANG